MGLLRWISIEFNFQARTVATRDIGIIYKSRFDHDLGITVFLDLVFLLASMNFRFLEVEHTGLLFLIGTNGYATNTIVTDHEI